jgi:hypothetical protein
MTLNKDNVSSGLGWIVGASFWSTIDPAKLVALDHAELVKVMAGVATIVWGHLTNHGSATPAPPSTPARAPDTDPLLLTLHVDTTQAEATLDALGLKLAAFNELVAMDAQTLMRNRRVLADAVQVAMQEGHPIIDQITGLGGPAK